MIKSKIQIWNFEIVLNEKNVFKINTCYQYFSNIAIRIRRSDIFKSCSYPSLWEKLFNRKTESHTKTEDFAEISSVWACHNHSLKCKNRKLISCIRTIYLASLVRGDPDPEQIINGVSDFSFSYCSDLMMFFEKMKFIWYSSYQHVTIKLN